ncbi:nuclear cohesin complex subunit [Blumeria hordei DH14]|uniref:Nuclear cohesin complex subunit n=1 Tax=Blumeria graminis f. sp. hordei (strain DH14) TaxID=546991 RepID=N1JMB6_BLUG1|nr:nuclear cohesin complex subunit [Blumeria hordei DH14]
MAIAINNTQDTPSAPATDPPAEPTRQRRSTRNVRPPQKYAAISTPTAVEPATSKRKRSEVELESASSDSDEENDTSDSSADEGKKGQNGKRKRVKKSTSKKPKLSHQTSRSEHKITTLPSRLKKNISRRVAIADKDAGGLYADIFISGETSKNVALQWLKRYREDGRIALTDLVNLVLRSSGCNIQVTVDDIDDVDNIDGRIADVQNDFQEQNITEYPLISRSKGSHNFRSNLIGFFDQLIVAMHESKVLYEETVLLENIHQWIATLSSSTTRPFRHTATLVALTMTTSRCRIARAEIEIAAKVQRQLENEAKNKRPNKARLADFQRRVDSNKERKSIIEVQIQDYFDTVYVHRYRDIDPKIRTECIEALGTWIVLLESYFFDGQYLRYIGWMLSDVHGPMRQEVVLQLQKIMKTVNHGGIRHFIDRFRPRLIEMAVRDSESGVRAHTVELLTMVRNAEMLEPDDLDIIGKLIYDIEPRVRKAVVNFFLSNINDLYDTRLQEIYGDDGLDIFGVSDDEDFETPRPSWVKYKTLAEFLVDYDSQDQSEAPSQIASAEFLSTSSYESRFTLAAQAIFDKMPELKEWEALAGYLLYDHTTTSSSPDNETENLFRQAVKPTEGEEIVLLEALNAAVKLGLQQIEDSAKGERKKQSKFGIAEAKEAAAHRLACIITRLLKKYSADPQIVSIVLRLAHPLKLEGFHEFRQNTLVCSKLLEEICTQFRSHADREVLKQASLALLQARSHEELEDITNVKIRSLWEESVDMLYKINDAAEISVRGCSLSENLLTELSQTLARLEQLSSISSSIEFMESDPGKGKQPLITLIFDVIARGELTEGCDVAFDLLEDTAVQSAIRSALFYFMWKTRDMALVIADSREISEAELELLKERQEVFSANLIASFSSRADLDDVRLLGAGTLLDLYVLFVASFEPANKPIDSQASQNSNANLRDKLHTLVTEIREDVQEELTLLFSELERHFAKKTKKKLNAPGDNEAPEDLDSEDEDDEDEPNESEIYAEALTAEEQLCQFSGKIVLALLAQVIDTSGPSKGKLRSRLLRNRNLLGPNFREVVGCLDDPKSKAKKMTRSKDVQDAKIQKKPAKSAELVEAEDDDSAEDDDPFAENAVENDQDDHEEAGEHQEESENEISDTTAKTNPQNEVDEEIIGD